MTFAHSGPRDRGLAILETEVSVLAAAMKRSNVWSRSADTDTAYPSLFQPFVQLKCLLTSGTVSHLDELHPSTYMTPFLDVIRSETEIVTGPVTGLALDAMRKFLSYELLHMGTRDICNAVDSLADAVTNARFDGVDPSADEVVLMKVLTVLRTLMLCPVGLLLTNERVCDIMQSTYKICFEARFSDLLRKTAEFAFDDMIQLLFTRLPSFTEQSLPLLKKLIMRNSSASDRGARHQHRNLHDRRPKSGHAKKQATSPGGGGKAKSQEPSSPAASAASSGGVTYVAMASPTMSDAASFSVDSDPLAAHSPTGSVNDLPSCVQSDNEEASGCVSDGPSQPPSLTSVNIVLTSPKGSEVVVQSIDCVEDEADPGNDATPAHEAAVAVSCPAGTSSDMSACDSKINHEEVDGEAALTSAAEANAPEQFTNAQGITFTPMAETVNESGSLIPYGLPCVREVFRFLILLISPYEGIAASQPSERLGSSSISFQNDSMVQIALSLLATTLETGAEHLDKFESLLDLVKDDLARNLVALLSSERVATFSSALWISYLLFAAQRKHLKYQMEIFVNKLMEVVSSESPRYTYEHKELVLELVVRLYKIPGFITELYVNYDCDMYTSNLFEDLTKMLSQNAFPLTGLYSTHFLSLDALLTVSEAIEKQCQRRIGAIDSRRYSHSMEPETNVLKQKQPMRPPVDDGKCHLSSGHIAGKTPSKPCSASRAGNDEEDDGDETCEPGRRPTTPPYYEISSHEELMALKYKKKLINSATEQFNSKPAKGIAYLQEVGLLKNPIDVDEVASFLRSNPHLDKKQLGEYLSNRKNLSVLEAFIKSFDFFGLRVDKSLRLFLESFRLPGEAPLITLILEHFADHWQKSNGDPFVNCDAAFTLSYGIIMLNVDQHNKNHTKTNDPMTLEQFRKNLRGVNGGGDFDPEMLGEIYHAIRNDEIVMPAEHTGLVKENYLWKCALKRGQENGQHLLSPTVMFDHDLFCLIWGPTVAALRYVFDKCHAKREEDATLSKCIIGFSRCASVAAHYRMTQVIDNVIVSLCKFSGLQNVSDSAYSFVPQFGCNAKALLATRTAFALAHRHGDFIRGAWKNILDVMLQLFKCELLPKSLMEAEDYIEAAGRVKLLREEAVQAAKVESGFLNSFVSFISMSTDSYMSVKPRTPDEEAAAKVAAKCIRDCNIDTLVSESKFLLLDSLQKLLEFLTVGASSLDFSLTQPETQPVGPSGGGGKRSPKPVASQSQCDTSGCEDNDGSGPGGYDEHSTLFFLELIVRVTIQNRDRVADIWPAVSGHIYTIVRVCSASQTANDKRTFLLERAVTALLRLGVRLARKEDLASLVVQSLHTLLDVKASTIFAVVRHIAFGMYELLRNNAANIHETKDWDVIFAILEVVGAGASPDQEVLTTVRHRGRPDEDSGHVASSESESRPASPATAVAGLIRERSGSAGSSSGGWIVLANPNAAAAPVSGLAVTAPMPLTFHATSIVHSRSIIMHDPIAFLKSCESMAFLIRDVAHITPHNFRRCVSTLRTFVEAIFVERPCEDASRLQQERSKAGGGRPQDHQKYHKNVASKSGMKKTPPGRAPPIRKVRSAPHNVRNGAGNVAAGSTSDYDADESDDDDLCSEYHHVALQLLDLMHTLHTRAAHIHLSWAQENPDDEASPPTKLWEVAWRPLLQGMARLCCDKRSHIRTSGLTTLQRALLFDDLQSLGCLQWEDSFTSVLFPMLNQHLIKSQPGEKNAMEETRTRAATLLGKVFLQHLNPLSSLASFASLWLTILGFMEQLIQSAMSDLLADAVPESLKNMLLVMDTAGIFDQGQHDSLWQLTWDKLHTFLPHLMPDLFGELSRTRQGPDGGSTLADDQPRHPAPLQLDNTDQGLSEQGEKDRVALPSPLEPPVKSPSFFLPTFPFPPSTVIATSVPPVPMQINLPSRPSIAPLPPPPIPLPTVINANQQVGGEFQPIHAAAVQSQDMSQPLVKPRPVLASYFAPPQSSAAAGNILTAAFTPTLSTASSMVVLPSPTQSPLMQDKATMK